MGMNNNSMRIIKDVYWPEKMKLFFEQTMRATPSQFRNIASGSLVREIEDKTRERNGNEVEEQDLVNAFLDSIPVYFRSDMMKLLSDLGINISRKTEEKIPVNDLVKMKEDIIKAVELAGVSYDNQILDSIMEAYKESLSNIRSCIALSTTTKKADHRGLTIHVVDIFNKVDPYKIAIENHLLVNNEMPIDHFVPELREMVPLLGYMLEFNAALGIESLSVMCASHLPQKLERVATLKSAPESMRINVAYLKKYGITHASIYGVNYLKGCAWTYSMAKQFGHLTCEMIESMLADFDFKIPSRNMIELCLNVNSVIIEFSYIKKQPQSIGFQVCVDSFEEIPKNMNSFIENFAKNVPFRSDKKKYMYVVVFTKNGQYLQLKGDYSATMVDCLTGPFNQKPNDNEE